MESKGVRKSRGAAVQTAQIVAAGPRVTPLFLGSECAVCLRVRARLKNMRGGRTAGEPRFPARGVGF